MLVLSSSETFNKDIQNLEPDERKMQTGLGKDSYIFQLGSNNRLREFFKHFEEPEEEVVEAEKQEEELETGEEKQEQELVEEEQVEDENQEAQEQSEEEVNEDQVETETETLEEDQ
jgi:hypothetical protein